MPFRTVAVVIGVNSAPGQTPLRNAENDARDLRRFLIGAGGPIAPDDVVLLIGAAASKAGVQAAFDDLRCRKPHLIVVFFAGHGGPNVLCLSDGDCPHDTFAFWIRSVGADRGAVVIDACHAGAFATQFGFGGMSGPPDEDWQSVLASSLPGMRLLLASQADEPSSDGPGRNGSFTGGLLAAFRHLPGELFADGRRYLSAEAVFRFARLKVSLATSGGQTPQAFGPTADFPIARPAALPLARPAPAPTARTRSASTSGIGATLLAGLFLGLTAYTLSSLPRWDPYVDRYRRRDGRFW